MEKEKVNKRKKQIVIGFLVFVLCVFGIGTGLHFYHEYQEEKELEEAKRHPYFTEDHLTVSEMHILRLFYYMDTDPYYVDEALEKEGPDFSYIEISPTEDTEKMITMINYYMYDRVFFQQTAAKEYAEKCGLSYGNRMTLDWVMDHLSEAAQILDQSPSIQDNLRSNNIGIYYNMLLSDPTYTSYQLSYRELANLYTLFNVEMTPKWNEIYLQFQEGQRDFTNVTLQATEYTEKAAAVMNWLLFEEEAPENAAGTEKAEEYGLSKENPVTAEWIITHPKETIEIKNAMENYGDIFYYGDKIEEIYNEIRSQ